MKRNSQTRKEGRKGELLFLLLFFILSVLTIVLGTYCLFNTKNDFIQKFFLLFSVLLSVAVSILCATSVWWTLSGKNVLVKGSLSFYVFLLTALGIYLALQKTGFFEVVKTPEKLQAYLEQTGIWMPFLYMLLQFLQVIVLPIPSVVSTVAGVALFGAFWTMIYSLAGILLGSIVAFLIGRKLGFKAVSWLVGEENLKKWQKKLKGKDNLFLTLMFLLPLFPDDILCFIAGLSSMSPRYFLGMIVVSRFIAISATCYSIDFIPFNTWWGITLWGIFLVGIITAFILIYKNMDKLQNYFKKLQKKKKK